MYPPFLKPLGISGVPRIKNLIKEAPLHLFLSRDPHVVGCPGRLGDLVVAIHVLFGGHYLGGQHLQASPFSRRVRSDEPALRAGRAEETRLVLRLMSNALYRPPRQVLPIIGGHLLPDKLKRSAHRGGNLRLQSYFHLPQRDSPYCWSSLLGLYTPFIRLRGYSLFSLAPQPRGCAAVVCGRLPLCDALPLSPYLLRDTLSGPST